MVDIFGGGQDNKKPLTKEQKKFCDKIRSLQGGYNDAVKDIE